MRRREAVTPMLLAVDWAGARLMGWPTLTLTQMVDLHGTLNVVCTAGCCLLGWHRVDARPLAGSGAWPSTRGVQT